MRKDWFKAALTEHYEGGAHAGPHSQGGSPGFSEEAKPACALLLLGGHGSSLHLLVSFSCIGASSFKNYTLVT